MYFVTIGFAGFRLAFRRFEAERKIYPESDYEHHR